MTDRKLVVFDIDGTIADNSHRQHFLEGTPDWHSFFINCVHDTPIRSTLDLLELYLKDPSSRVELWTGRPEWCRKLTTKWLYDNNVSIEHVDDIKMRPNTDFKPNWKIKQGWAFDDKPFIAFDDDQTVVDMFADDGVACLKVNV